MKKILTLLMLTVFSVSFVHAQDVWIPDANFKAALVANLDINTNNDGEIQVAEAAAYTGRFDVTSKDISDLTGIAAFTAITNLYCASNSLTSLDVSANTHLGYINCSFNPITNLSLINNIELASVDCINCQLTSLDISANTNLLSLQCGGNYLTNLDLSGKPSLQYLNCGGNALASLNVSNNPNLIILECYSNQLTSLDISNNPNLYRLNASFNQLTSLDVSHNPNLGVLYFSFNQVTSLNVSANTALQSIIFESNQISSLNVSANTALNYLICSYNQLSSLNLSGNTNLTHLDCKNNNITSLDVSANTLLSSLDCSTNQLTDLNLSANAALTEILCNDNLLTSLNIKNGNYVNLTNFRAYNNPSLTCVKVDDAAYMNTNWQFAIDITASYNENCDCIVTIIDANFKAALLANAAINTNNDGEIQCTEATAYTGTLDVRNLGIIDLTGIESFTGITGLNCSFNNLTSLNVLSNTSLTSLDCKVNQLSSLNVSANTQLYELICNENQLTNLDISLNTLLINLACSYNQLTSLNLSSNTALSYLEFDANNIANIDLHSNINLTAVSCLQGNLSSLDLSLSPLLTNLNCDRNSISSLNLSANPLLSSLSCRTNQLTNLDLSANQQLIAFGCDNNPLLNTVNIKNGNNSHLWLFTAINNPSLACIQVDDVTYMNNNWSAGKDATASFSENCGGCPVYFASLGLATGSSPDVCAGSSTNLAVNITGGNSTNTYFDITYQYGIDYVTSRVFATGSNVSLPVSVTPTSTITYKLLSIIDANGCEGLIGPSNSDTFELITVKPLPTITANPVSTTNLCPGTLVRLTSSRSSTGYLWNNGKITRSINVYTDGNYAVAGNGCTSAPVTVSYLPCNAPSGISIVSNTGTTATVNFAQITCGQSYELRYKLKAGGIWTKITDITSSPYTISGLTPNTFYKMQMRTVCNRNQLKFSDWTIVYVFKTATAFTSNQSNQLLLNEPQSTFAISVAPNPASTITTLAIKGTTKPVTISITDMAGKVLKTYHNVTDRQYKIPVSNLAKGMYLVTVTDEVYTQTLKLVKE